MGLALSRLQEMLSFSTPTRVLLLGLDAAGKTTVLYKLKLNEVVTTIPTIGFNVEHLKYKNLDMTMWDVGGQDKIRPLWRHYYDNTDALIYVVDSNDPQRLAEARGELHQMLQEDGLRRAAVLVLANKQDLRGAERPDKLAQALALDAIRGHRYSKL